MLWSPFAEFVAWWLTLALLAFVGFGPLFCNLLPGRPARALVAYDGR